MPIKAYSYIRFSRPEQIKGNSLTRQKEMSELYCMENNLILDTSLSLYDKGVSAYKGKNAEQGALAEFLQAIETGVVSAGSYLIVENLDRLSRQSVPTALKLFLSILEKQITIVTLSDGMKYEYENLNTNELFISIVIMSRAYEESKMKSKRLSAAWKVKRENTDKIKMTKVAVAWLKLSKDRTKFNLIPERVSIIQDIYQWSLEGLGTSKIIQRLENNKIKTFGRSESWAPSSVQKILSNRAVLGELESNSNEGNKTIPDYYPAIISEDLFYCVQNAIQSRNVSGGGRKGKGLTNLFQKIIVCGYSIDDNTSGYKCSGNNVTVVVVNKATKKRPGYKYLQCSKLKKGNTGCTQCRKTWRYDHFEASFLSFINEIDISSLIGNTDELKQQIDNLQSLLVSDNEKLKHIKRQIEKITQAALDSEIKIPDSILIKGNDLEREQQTTIEIIKANNTTLKALQYDYEKSDKTKEKLSQLISIMPTLETEKLYELRQQLSSLLQKYIERIDIFPCGNIITDKFIAEARKKQGKKAANILKKNKEQTKGKSLPYFIARFKTGNFQLVATDPKDPTNLYISITPEITESMALDSRIPRE